MISGVIIDSGFIRINPDAGAMMVTAWHGVCIIAPRGQHIGNRGRRRHGDSPGYDANVQESDASLCGATARQRPSG